MEEKRELVKRIVIEGTKYDFDVIVNRQIVLDAFKKNKKFWEVLTKVSKEGYSDGFVDDIDKFAKLVEENDIIEQEKPKFVECILPKMVELAGSNVDALEFLDFCKENEVEDTIYDKIVEFAMLGFTGGKSVKKPKLKVMFE